MKHLAKFFLVCGLCIIGISLTVAATTIGSDNNSQETAAEDETCLFCHVDAHVNWSVVSAPTLDQENMFAGGAADDLRCADCHAMEIETPIPTAAIEDQVAQLQQRISVLKAELTEIQLNHPEWQSEVARSQKSDAQIMAEHIAVTISIIEADGGWGFHDVNYTEDILSEAETLIAELHADLGA